AIAGAVPTGHARSEQAIPQHATVAATPTAADFGSELAGVMNQAAREHGDPARIQRPSCVQASPAHYMCTYIVGNPGKPPECHLTQGRWTPQLASTITVTLSGRTGRCGTLREAIRTLR